jgi:transposase-like protein
MSTLDATADAPLPGTSVEPSMTSVERAARCRSVAEARARGEGWSSIAARHGIGERQARRDRDAWLKHVAATMPLTEDPHAVLSEVIAHHRAALVDLARLSREGNNPSARVGAARARAETARALLALLAAAGVVPETARAWSFTRDMGVLTRAVAEVCRRHGIDLSEVLDEFERLPGYVRSMGIAQGSREAGS